MIADTSPNNAPLSSNTQRGLREAIARARDGDQVAMAVLYRLRVAAERDARSKRLYEEALRLARLPLSSFGQDDFAWLRKHMPHEDASVLVRACVKNDARARAILRAHNPSLLYCYQLARIFRIPQQRVAYMRGLVTAGTLHYRDGYTADEVFRPWMITGRVVREAYRQNQGARGDFRAMPPSVRGELQ